MSKIVEVLGFVLSSALIILALPFIITLIASLIVSVVLLAVATVLGGQSSRVTILNLNPTIKDIEV